MTPLLSGPLLSGDAAYCRVLFTGKPARLASLSSATNEFLSVNAPNVTARFSWCLIDETALSPAGANGKWKQDEVDNTKKIAITVISRCFKTCIGVAINLLWRTRFKIL